MGRELTQILTHPPHPPNLTFHNNHLRVFLPAAPSCGCSFGRPSESFVSNFFLHLFFLSLKYLKSLNIVTRCPYPLLSYFLDFLFYLQGPFKLEFIFWSFLFTIKPFHFTSSSLLFLPWPSVRFSSLLSHSSHSILFIISKLEHLSYLPFCTSLGDIDVPWLHFLLSKTLEV